MKGLERLGVIRELSRKNPEWKHKELFRLLRKEDIWIAAYENIKGTGIANIQKVQKKVLVESYRFRPVKQTWIPKATPNDKLVQEVIQMVLEAIYEPNFDDRSFGFQTGIGVHDALQYVENQFRWVDWVIKGDNPTIEHKKLCEILSQRIDDERFMNLIRKSLKCGISKLGAILVNIYFNELDKWVTQRNSKERIRYARYADDWIIGIKGSSKLVEQIKNEVGIFLRNHLKQELDPDKTKVINIRAGKISFLGYDIFLPRRRSTPRLRFQLPVDKVIKRLHERGYITYVGNKIRPVSKRSYTPLEDEVIVNHFKSVWLGLLNFYSGITNWSHLQYIHYLLHMSCAMTLAHRHRSSSSKIFKKQGKRLEIMDTSFPYHTSWKVSNRKWHSKHLILI